MNYQQALKRIGHIQIIMTEPQQRFLFEFAQKYGGDDIVEIGAFMGGSTSLLCLARPEATVHVFDKFEHPYGDPTAEKLRRNLCIAGVKNYELTETDSLRLEWDRPIDLLFVDGKHEYLYVKHDIMTFAPHARYVVLHDTHIHGVQKAADEYFGTWVPMQAAPRMGAWRRGDEI